MSDGPHRSLPMKQHWKDVAERASKPAYVAPDVAEAFRRAIALEMADAPIQAIRQVLGAGDEGSLFAGDQEAIVDQLDRVRALCRGSAAGNAVIDGAVQAVLEGADGNAAFESALAYGAEKIAQSHNRSIEEHYQRKAGDRSARYMRDRLGDAVALCDLAAVAGNIARSRVPMERPLRLERHTGLDQGPPL